MSESPTAEFDPVPDLDPGTGFDGQSWSGSDDADADSFVPDDPSWVESDPIGAVSGGEESCSVSVDRLVSALPGAESWAPNGSLVLSVDGSSYDLGIPTLDMDGDGRPDSTLIRGGDGQLYLVSDLTDDGLADGLVIADQNGTVLGGFQIVDGAVVPIQLAPGAIGSQDPTPVGPSVAADPDLAPSPIPTASTQPLTVSFDTGTEVVDLGPATLDLDGDGIPESVMVPNADGRPGYLISELPTGADGLLILDPLTGDIVHSFVSEAGRIREGINVFGELSDAPGVHEIPADQIGVAPDPSAPVPSAGPRIDPTTDPVPSAEPVPSTSTDGPETVLAPTTADLSIPEVALVQQGVQGMYDVASQVWFDLTGGEPYPRRDDGTPFNPGQLFGLLNHRPDTSHQDQAELQGMQTKWEHMVTTVSQGTGAG